MAAAAPAVPGPRRHGGRAPQRVPHYASRAAAKLCVLHGAALIGLMLVGAPPHAADDAAAANADTESDMSDTEVEERRGDAPPGTYGDGAGAQGAKGTSAGCAVCLAAEDALAVYAATAAARAAARRLRRAAARRPAEEFVSCPVCLDTLHQPVLTRCKHAFCDLCIRRYLHVNGWAGNRPCPLCRAPVREAELTADTELAARVEAHVGAEAHAARAEAVNVQRQAWGMPPSAGYQGTAAPTAAAVAAPGSTLIGDAVGLLVMIYILAHVLGIWPSAEPQPSSWWPFD